MDRRPYFKGWIDLSRTSPCPRGHFEPLCLLSQKDENPAFPGLSSYSGGGIRTRDLRVMRLILRSAGLRGARLEAAFSRSNYVGIGWDLWGFLPHFLPHGAHPAFFNHREEMSDNP